MRIRRINPSPSTSFLSPNGFLDVCFVNKTKQKSRMEILDIRIYDSGVNNYLHDPDFNTSFYFLSLENDDTTR